MSLGHTSSAIHLTGNALPSTMYVLLFSGSCLLKFRLCNVPLATFFTSSVATQPDPAKCDHSTCCIFHDSRPLPPTDRSTRTSDWYALGTED